MTNIYIYIKEKQKKIPVHDEMNNHHHVLTDKMHAHAPLHMDWIKINQLGKIWIDTHDVYFFLF